MISKLSIDDLVRLYEHLTSIDSNSRESQLLEEITYLRLKIKVLGNQIHSRDRWIKLFKEKTLHEVNPKYTIWARDRRGFKCEREGCNNLVQKKARKYCSLSCARIEDHRKRKLRENSNG